MSFATSAATRTFASFPTSVSGQKRNSNNVGPSSGFPSTADIERAQKNAAWSFPRGAFSTDPERADQLAARRLTLLSASVVSFLSVAFSSSSVFCRTLAQSLRPSCLERKPAAVHPAFFLLTAFPRGDAFAADFLRVMCDLSAAPMRD